MMTRKAAEGPDLMIRLRPGGEPLYRQICGAIRDAIRQRVLRPGQRLPSTRTLARDLAVSRNTVGLAFDALWAEGWIERQPRSGTRVAADPPEALAPAPTPDRDRSGEAPVATLPVRSAAARAASRHEPRQAVESAEGASIPFRPGVPELRRFPHESWRRIASRIGKSPGPGLLDYGDPRGWPPLRQAIARHLAATRGVRCDPDQVIVVAGSQHGLNLAGKALLEVGDTAAMEDPGYQGARLALATAARVIGVPVDREGLVTSRLAELAPDARLVYVCPSHQFPSAVTMSAARREALIEWARRADAWVIEDDYDSEFRYEGRALPAIQGLDDEGRVVYVGTFSKSLFPALRLGYIVAPKSIVEPLLALRAAEDIQPPAFQQAVLADFMRQGLFERHVRRMRRLYQARRDALVEAARAELAGLLDVPMPRAGTHALGHLQPDTDAVAAAARAAEHQVDVIPLSWFRVSRPPPPGLVLGYAGFDRASIRDAVSRLARALRSAS